MASITIYSECYPLEIGCHIFTDVGQTILLTNTWISDGIFKYQLNGDGIIIDKVECII
jgi:hypothetical protein